MNKIPILAATIVLGFLGFSSAKSVNRQPHVLVFSKTAAFYHLSIPISREALLKMANERGFVADTTTNASFFTDEKLGQYDAVVFLNTTGDVLDDAQQAAFERYIRAGGGYVGIHAASDTEYDWPWYGQLVGAYFINHPAIQEANLHVVDADHPATRELPTTWTRTDEWYNLRYVNDEVRVLITLDKGSYRQRNDEPGEGEHPHSWYHEFDGGRSFYTAMGHTDESFSESLFLSHLWGGLQYAMGTSDDATNQ